MSPSTLFPFSPVMPVHQSSSHALLLLSPAIVVRHGAAEDEVLVLPALAVLGSRARSAGRPALA